jgi:hypothetical protein
MRPTEGHTPVATPTGRVPMRTGDSEPEGRGHEREEATANVSRWPLAWSIRSGQLTVNSFCMPMKAWGVPSGPGRKHTAP